MFGEPTRAFLKDTGVFLQLPGVLCIPTFVVIAVFEEWYALFPFAMLAVISFGLGQLLYRSFRDDEETVPGSSYAIVSLVWFMLPLLGTIPFVGVALLIPEANDQVAVFSDYSSAFFESMSGFTGTGLTMLEDSSKIPHCLQWWRSTSEWIGGLGIIFLAVAILDTAHGDENLYQSEAMGWTRENKDPTSKIIKIWWIYISYTALSVLLFLAAGMPIWEALNHGITGISTGGFTVTKDSFVSYDQKIKWVATVIMLLGSLSFKIHYLLIIDRNFHKLFRQTQLRYSILLFMVVLVVVFLTNNSTEVVDIFFQSASALGTCGFNSVDLSSWTALFLLPLMLAMFIGGNSSSTTGGLKTQRLAWLVKTMRENVRQSLTPEKEKFKFTIRYSGELVDQEEAFKNIRLSSIMLLVWIFTLAIGTLLITFLLHDQYPFYEILFDVNSALNNVGLSAGLTGHQLPGEVKWIMSIIMWIGRLEVMGVIIMFSFFLGRNKT